MRPFAFIGRLVGTAEEKPLAKRPSLFRPWAPSDIPHPSVQAPVFDSHAAEPDRPWTIDQYVVDLEPLGAGASATVHRAQSVLDLQPVALKIWDGGRDGLTDRTRERARREVAALQEVSHRGVVGVHGFDLNPNANPMYLAMQLVEGPNLKQWVESGEPPSLHEAALATLEIFEALTALERANIVHRDIKPENILRDADGRMRLTDFGVVKHLGLDEALTLPEEFVGTAHYTSPNMARGNEATTKDDLYAATCVMAYLGARQHPGDVLLDTPSLMALMYMHSKGGVIANAETKDKMRAAIGCDAYADKLFKITEMALDGESTAWDVVRELRPLVRELAPPRYNTLRAMVSPAQGRHAAQVQSARQSPEATAEGPNASVPSMEL